MEGLGKFVETLRLKYHPTPESALDDEIYSIRLAARKAKLGKFHVKFKISSFALEVFQSHGLILSLVYEAPLWFGYKISFIQKSEADQRDDSPVRK